MNAASGTQHLLHALRGADARIGRLHERIGRDCRNLGRRCRAGTPTGSGA